MTNSQSSSVHTLMGTDANLAAMLQFADSALPIGTFAFSSGLETAIHAGIVSDSASLESYVHSAVEQAALGDGIAVICAHRAAALPDLAALVWIDDSVYARKLASEIREMTVRVGKKFTQMAANIVATPLLNTWREHIEKGVTPGCYPVALGVVFAAQGLPAHAAFSVHQYGVAAAILSAALRLMRIGHPETQRILYKLGALTNPAFESAAAARIEDMAGFAPLTDIFAAAHAKAHVRLFMS